MRAPIYIFNSKKEFFDFQEQIVEHTECAFQADKLTMSIIVCAHDSREVIDLKTPDFYSDAEHTGWPVSNTPTHWKPWKIKWTYVQSM